MDKENIENQLPVSGLAAASLPRPVEVQSSGSLAPAAGSEAEVGEVSPQPRQPASKLRVTDKSWSGVAVWKWLARGSNGTEAGPEYAVRSVERQFIVTCRGWFSEAARRGYISAALRTLGGEVTVLGRDNPMAGLPSDFDLVKVSRRGPSSCLPLTTLPGWRKQNHWSLLLRRLPSSLFCFLWKAWN